MSLVKLSDTIGDIKRFRQVASILFEEGFAYVFERAKLSFLVPIQCRIRCFFKSHVGMWSSEPPEDLPTRLRRTLIKLGPTFVKFGQVLSLRPDLIPQEYAQELAKLTNQVPAVSWQEAKRVIESDFGKPVEELFRQIDTKPLAAASLAQVYKAVLHDGKTVAVKVQRPGVREVIEKDIHIMAFFARMIEEKLPEWQIYRPVELVREFADTIGRELDFTIEAIHAKRFAAMFADDPTIRIARVYKEYSSKNVLTMDLIKGVQLDDEETLKKASIDKKILAQNGVNALLRQVFVEGFFHADPHPGNYFALRGNVFAFIDYGMVGRLLQKDRLELASFFISFLNEDSESAIKHLLHMVDTSKATNLASFEHDVDDTLHEWYGAKLADVSIAQAFLRIIESGRKNGIYFPSSFAYLGKSLLTTEAMGFSLDPEFDLAEQMRPYIKKIIKEELNPVKTRTKILDQSLDYINYAQTFPEATMRLLEKLDKGEVGVKINQEEMRELELRLSWSGNRKLLATIIGSTLFALGAAYVIESKALNLHFSISAFSIAAIMVLLILILRKR